MVKVSAFQPLHFCWSPTEGHDLDSRTGWFQEADSRVIYISCKNLFKLNSSVHFNKRMIIFYISVFNTINMNTYVLIFILVL